MKTCHNCACDPVCDHNWNGWETCGNWIQKPGEPPTNADRIRVMSDEKLAVFLDDLTCLCVDCNDHDGVNENCPIYKQGCGRYCEPKDLMHWLQQPAEEAT